ncbi:glycosyltransferase family 4 protein [Polaribacter vadi]|uniref:glycosyltransferase family 4 protein n=1 Tax=Polaribacter TaxID=52959 RepID=UPI001C0940DD|nr:MULTISPECIES: glycosyltransferase family 4 protein [Polaribacter]MBU3009867.1 glycosyltransferase family 4 protein [Polaribacter vadi]MDO6739673.1 glycosyltransferase family 4 protein [Polaribacter sp. 1_MG-2023]
MKKRLSVLFLCGWYPSKISATNGDFIQRHAETVFLEHNVTVVHIISDKKATKNIIITENTINGVETFIAYTKFSKNPLKKAILFFNAFRLLLNKIKPFDVVHLNEIFPFGIFSLYLKWFKKTPYIISEHWTGYLKKAEKSINFLEKSISKIITKNAVAICAVSNYLAKNLQDLDLKGNYKVVANVVNSTLFIPQKKEDSILRIIHISSLKNEHKNIKGMLRVAARLSNKIDYFEWNFIGNNGLEYQEFLQSLNIKNAKISFAAHKNHHEIVNDLQQATVCVSFSNYETFGIVIPEAISCGTPVIATNTGISTSFKNENFCKVINIKDEDALLSSILNHKTIFADLDINEMHNFIKLKFSKDVIAKQFSELYFKSINS